MKTLTCSQLGGMCEEKISGATEQEMIANGMKHLEVAHPEMAENIKSMPITDPLMVEWSEKFQKSFAEAPDEPVM